jgi:hypothetical protein
MPSARITTTFCVAENSATLDQIAAIQNQRTGWGRRGLACMGRMVAQRRTEFWKMQRNDSAMQQEVWNLKTLSPMLLP